MGKVKNDWQDRDYVLKWFGKTKNQAKEEYRDFVKKGIDQGRRPELVGGGFIRSIGGWSAVKALRRDGDRELSDDRILCSGDFVEQIVKEAEGNVIYQLPVKEQSQNIDESLIQICKKAKVSIKELRLGGRRREVSGVRSLIAIKLVDNHGVSLAEVASRVGVSTTGISKIIKRASQWVRLVHNVSNFYIVDNWASLIKKLQTD